MGISVSLEDALFTLNTLVGEGIIGEYAIGGGYAVMYYDIPTATYDLDILVVLANDDDYHKLYQYFRGKGVKSNQYIYLLTICQYNFFPIT